MNPGCFVWQTAFTTNIRGPTMRRPGVRFKARTLRVTVAIVAIPLAAFRVENAPGAAIAIIGSWIFYRARKRY